MAKDVLLVGLGAVGAIYAHILKKSGLARVTAVARSNYEIVNMDMKAHGLNFKSAKYGNIFGWKPDRLCNSVASAADQPYSHVVVATKAIPELMKTSTLLAPLLTGPYAHEHPQPTYVLMQNGLNVEVDLYHAIEKLGRGAPRIISTASWIATNLTEGNLVEHGGWDTLRIGIYRHNNYTTTTNNSEEADLLSDFGRMLEQGGTTLTIDPEIQRVKFAKNFWNAAFASFSTLTNYPLPAIFRAPPASGSSSQYTPYTSPTTAELIETYTLPSVRATLQELLALGRALGFPDSPEGLPSSVVEDTVARTARLHESPDSWHKPSMLLDVEQGKPIEVEVILGNVVRMAKERGIDMPRVETLYALLLVVQNQLLRKIESK